VPQEAINELKLLVEGSRLLASKICVNTLSLAAF